jgi:hypothetical protein
MNKYSKKLQFNVKIAFSDYNKKENKNLDFTYKTWIHRYLVVLLKR